MHLFVFGNFIGNIQEIAETVGLKYRIGSVIVPRSEKEKQIVKTNVKLFFDFNTEIELLDNVAALLNTHHLITLCSTDHKEIIDRQRKTIFLYYSLDRLIFQLNYINS